MTINRFEDLEIWQDARKLAKEVFILSREEPFVSNYRFCGQIRESSGSVMDNIAEGFERDGKMEFRQFLSVAKGSCGETRSQSYRAFDYEYINENQLNHLLEETNKLSAKIGKLIQYLNKTEIKGTKFK